MSAESEHQPRTTDITPEEAYELMGGFQGGPDASHDAITDHIASGYWAHCICGWRGPIHKPSLVGPRQLELRRAREAADHDSECHVHQKEAS